MNIRPLGDRVLLKEVERETVSKGGIYIPPTAKDQTIAARAEVVAVGPGKHLENGTLIESRLKKGDKVIYGKYQGAEVTIEGEKFRLVSEDLIEAIYEED